MGNQRQRGCRVAKNPYGLTAATDASNHGATRAAGAAGDKSGRPRAWQQGMDGAYGNDSGTIDT